MSGGGFCTCNKTVRVKRSDTWRRENWRVYDRNCNYSAFNGRKWTPSTYSCIHCLTCGAFWRTKAKYVQILQDDSAGNRGG